MIKILMGCIIFIALVMFYPELKRLLMRLHLGDKLNSSFDRLRNISKKEVIADVEEIVTEQEEKLQSRSK